MVLGRQVGCPALRPADRAVLAGLIRLMSKVRRGRFLVQPEAMLRWRRDLVCRRWTFRQKAVPGWLVLPTGPVQLVVRSARENPTWATEESTVSWPR